jgi:transposase-like protein
LKVTLLGWIILARRNYEVRVDFLTFGKFYANITSLVSRGVVIMIVKTRIFELRNDNYGNLSELARAMGISVSQIYRIRQGKRSINQKFIVGAIKAFPRYKLDELFYLASESLEMRLQQKEPQGGARVCLGKTCHS